MIDVPIDVIKEKIEEQTDLSREDIDGRIDSKLEELSGLISKEGAAHIVASELGVNLLKAEGTLKIGTLIAGMKSITLPARVVKKYELRTFENDRGAGKYAKFLAGDDSGVTMVVMWNDATDSFEKLNESDVVRVKNGNVRENNGRVEIHLSEPDSLEVNPVGLEVKSGSIPRSDVLSRKRISELKDNDSNVEIFATIVQVFDPKFFDTCPECRRKATLEDSKYVCKEHGAVTPDVGAVLNIFVDDSSDNIRVVLWKEQLMELLKADESKLKSYRDSPDSFETQKTDLLGEMVKFTGRVSKNTLFDRLEFVAQKVVRDVDPQEEMDNVSSSEEKQLSGTQEQSTPKESEKKPEILDEDDELLNLEDLEDLEDLEI